MITKSYSIDVDTGNWVLAEGFEHPRLAVPKIVDQLNHRLNMIASNIAALVRATITRTTDTQAIRGEFHFSIDTFSKELHHHSKLINDYILGTVRLIRKENQESNGSRYTLEKVSDSEKLEDLNDKSHQEPINEKYHKLVNPRNILSSHPRLGNKEMIQKLATSRQSIHKLLDLLPKVESCWTHIMDLELEDDSEVLLNNIREIHQDLKEIDSEEICGAFFHVDDATEGILRAKTPNALEFNHREATLKIIKLIHRTFLHGLENYNTGNEKELTEKALEKIRELNTDNIKLEHINALEEAHLLLEIKTAPSPSEHLCLKKFGELHANIRQKCFELSSLNNLKPYFPASLQELSSEALFELHQLHQTFIRLHEVSREEKLAHRTSIADENIRELEITARFIENRLLASEPGEKYFSLMRQLHEVNHHIANKYTDTLTLERCKEILGSNLFKNCVITLSELMLSLREEQSTNRNVPVDPRDLAMVGLSTGKTTMINSYFTALEELLAPLSTFMGNTLHALIAEMVSYSPDSAHLKWAYIQTSRALKELDRRILSNSTVAKIPV